MPKTTLFELMWKQPLALPLKNERFFTAIINDLCRTPFSFSIFQRPMRFGTSGSRVYVIKILYTKFERRVLFNVHTY